MRDKTMKTLIVTAALFAAFAISASAEVYVVTTDTNIADIAKHVGGNRVRVESLSRGVDDPHQVEPRPSMVTKLARAQVFARIGMDLDILADGVLEKSGKRQVMKGGAGFADFT